MAQVLDELTSLVGREDALRELRTWLLTPGVRHLTLTGPGGIGKTRLAWRGAALVAPDFPDGVVRVELAALADPALVPGAIAAALALPLAGERPVPALLIEHLRNRSLLLVFDNFEHLLAAAPLVPQLLGACPELVILLTSRERLGTVGEQVVPVGALAVPAADAGFAAIAASPAVQLFVTRAAMVRPGFAVTAANAAAVAAICRRLDGMPLALELAAARVAHFSPTVLAEHVGQLLPLLAGGRDRPERQRTMLAAMGWSYDLLSPAEQQLFTRLAVCPGGCTLAGAAVIGGLTTPAGEPDAMATMLGVGSLVDQNLLRLLPAPLLAEPSRSPAPTPAVATDAAAVGIALAGDLREQTEELPPRYGMLEPIREFGLAALADRGETVSARQAMADWLLAELARLRIAWRDSDPGRWVRTLRPEVPNIRATLRWLLDGDREQQRQALQLANEITQYFLLEGMHAEGQQWLQAALTALPDERSLPVAGGRMLLGNLLIAAEPRSALAQYEQSLALFRELGFPDWERRMLVAISVVVSDMGDQARSLAFLTEAATLPDLPADLMTAAFISYHQGRAMLRRGDFADALRDFDEARSLAEQVKEREVVVSAIIAQATIHRLMHRHDIAELLLAWSAERLEVEPIHYARITLANELGALAVTQARFAAAAQHFREALRLGIQVGNANLLLGIALGGLTATAGAPVQQGHVGRALAAIAAWERRSGFQLDAVTRQLWHRAEGRARRALGAAAWADAWSTGQLLSLSEAAAPLLAAVRDEPPASPEPQATYPLTLADPDALTRQEGRVLTLVAEGMSNQQIADTLAISHRTAANHVTNILSKLGVQNRTQAAAIAARRVRSPEPGSGPRQ